MMEDQLTKAHDLLRFIYRECDWEKGSNYGSCDMCSVSGDDRIGGAIKHYFAELDDLDTIKKGRERGLI